MPELPEVETVRRGLAPVLEGYRILSVEARRPDLRVPLPSRFAERLAGTRVLRLRRRAKYLLADLDSGEVLLMHLGMSGSFRIQHPKTSIRPGAFHHERGGGAHDHIAFRMEAGAEVVFNDPRRFGLMTIVSAAALDAEPLLIGLGPEPLEAEFRSSILARACLGRATSLKATLLDQRVVAGLGNIYVCEALHRAELSPRRLARTLATRSGAATPRAERLVGAIKGVLEDAIAAGGSTLRDHRQASGELGSFQHRFRVYDRAGQPCVKPGCGGIIRRIVQNGRSSYFCPRCQR